MNSNDRNDPTLSRRDLVKAAAYTAPAILTLKALPAFASQGSGNFGGNREEQGNGGTGGNQGNGRSGGNGRTGGNGGNGGTGRGRGN